MYQVFSELVPYLGLPFSRTYSETPRERERERERDSKREFTRKDPETLGLLTQPAQSQA